MSCSSPEFDVQSPELFKEPPVWENPSSLLHSQDGVQQGEMMVDHEEGQDESRRPAHPNGTVHQNTTSGVKKRKKQFTVVGALNGRED